MVSFENFVKSMPPSLSELKVIPSFCFAFKIPDDMTATSNYTYLCTYLNTYLLSSTFNNIRRKVGSQLSNDRTKGHTLDTMYSVDKYTYIR